LIEYEDRNRPPQRSGKEEKKAVKKEEKVIVIPAAVGIKNFRTRRSEEEICQ
jgi:hypothetical protein